MSAVGLPEGWVWTEVGELADVVMGQSPPGSTYNAEGRGVPLINGPVEFGPTAFSKTIRAKFTTAPAKMCMEGDLILCVRGSTTGRMNLAGFDACIGRGVAAIRARACQAYLNWVIHSMQRSIYDMGTGSTFPNVSSDVVSSLRIPVAPLREQERIASSLDELFSRLDAGVAALERVRANLKRYRAAVLKAAVEGKLTEQWRAEHPDTKPASVLLDRILRERRRKWEEDQLATFAEKGTKPPKNWEAKYREPQPPDTTDLPELPEGWVWSSVEQLNPADRPCAYGVLQPGDDRTDGIPMVRVMDIADGNVAVDQLKRIDPDISRQYRRTVLQGGEVLITIVGTIGRTAVAPPQTAGANIARAVAVLPISSPVLSRYVEITLRAPRMRARLTNAAHEVARKTLNLEDVRAAPIPLAALNEQAAIVAEVERRLSVLDEIERETEAALKRAARLRQSILKRAFEGRLVPQDPNDEPASVLLERIKAERAAVAPSARRSRKGYNGEGTRSTSGAAEDRHSKGERAP